MLGRITSPSLYPLSSRLPATPGRPTPGSPPPPTVAGHETSRWLPSGEFSLSRGLGAEQLQFIHSARPPNPGARIGKTPESKLIAKNRFQKTFGICLPSRPGFWVDRRERGRETRSLDALAPPVIASGQRKPGFPLATVAAVNLGLYCSKHASEHPRPPSASQNHPPSAPATPHCYLPHCHHHMLLRAPHALPCPQFPPPSPTSTSQCRAPRQGPPRARRNHPRHASRSEKTTAELISARFIVWMRRHL